MDALVIFESVYGNTRAIAHAIAEGLGGASVLAVSSAPEDAATAELVVVGGPTHMHGLSTAMSRRAAADAAEEDGGEPVDPAITSGLGLRGWLCDLPDGAGALAAAFDTRLDKSPLLTGVAARGIARRLRHHGYEVLASESFLVSDAEGPLEEGELERARAWGAELAGELSRAREAGPLRATDRVGQ